MKNKVFAIFLSLFVGVLFVFLNSKKMEAASDSVSVAAFKNAEYGEILVKYKDQQKPQRLNFEDNQDASQVLKVLKKDEKVEIAQPNYIYRAALIPDDPLRVSQKYLEQINVRTGWDVAVTAHDVVIAVIDSGIEINHPDLEANIWQNPLEVRNNLDDDGNGFVDDLNGWDFLLDNQDVRPKFLYSTAEDSIGVQHGTLVAGIIAGVGNNGLGISGISWDAQLMSLRVLDSAGIGNSETVTQAFDYALNQGADIINLSLIGTDYDPLFVELLNQAYKRGVIIVSAAGNDGVNLNAIKTYPVCYNHLGAATIIGVGATDEQFGRPGFSNYGNDCIDIVAPGIKPFSTRVVREHFKSQELYGALFSGTSFAAPQVTGTVALIKQLNYSLTPDEVLNILQAGATSIEQLHHVSVGFDHALNVGGSLVLVEPKSAVEANGETGKNPKFLVYPLNEVKVAPYQYQLPGPQILSPLILDGDQFDQGMRWTQHTPFTWLVSAWKKDSKKIWRYNFVNGSLEVLFEVSADNQQTVGQVAVGNVDFDEEKEIVIASGPNSLPLIGVYTGDGLLKYQIKPYDKLINQGLEVALLDINGDSVLEIVTVPVAQTNGLIRVFEYTGLKHLEWEAYKNFGGGATLSTADVNNDGVMELLVGPGYTGGPHIKIFDVKGKMIKEFFAGDVIDGGGADVDFYDFDKNGNPEYVMAYKQSHTPVLRLYGQNGEFFKELGVLDGKYRGGVGVIPL